MKLALMQSVTVLATTFDLYMVKIISHNHADTDKYAAIIAITGIFLVIIKNTYSMLSPKIAYCLENNRIDELQKVINQCNKLHLLLTGVVVLLIIVFGKIVLGWFGSHYATDHVYLALILMVAGRIFDGIRNPARQLSMFGGGEKRSLIVSGLQLLLLLILCGVLIPKLDIFGAALAYLIPSVLATAYVHYAVRKRLPVNPLGI